jgi:hypothetical protein
MNKPLREIHGQEVTETQWLVSKLRFSINEGRSRLAMMPKSFLVNAVFGHINEWLDELVDELGIEEVEV